MSRLSASIYLTLHWHAHPHKPLDWIFIHVPMRLMLVVLFSVDLLDNGFIVLGWEARDEARYAKYSLQAVAAIATVNVVGLIIVAAKRDLGQSFLALPARNAARTCADQALLSLLFPNVSVWAISACYLLVALLLKKPKPVTVVATIITFLVLYPLVYLVSLALHRRSTREGRIRLEEDAILARNDDERVAGPRVAAGGRVPKPVAAPPANGAEAA